MIINPPPPPPTNQIIQGDSLQVLKDFEEASIDCVITDPPYGYSFMNKDWDKAVVSVDIWKECLRVLKPGSFTAIMSSPRQDVLARMIVNLQDAGFRTDFTSIYWTYASGFPKAANVSKLVDKRLGMERNRILKSVDGKIKGNKFSGSDGFGRTLEYIQCDVPISQQAQALDGSYAGFQPKPAVEVILMVMKPLSEKSYVDQAFSNSKGITWLDGCRIPFQDDIPPHVTRMIVSGIPHAEKDGGRPWINERIEKGLPVNDYTPNQKGRFPANLLVSDDVLNDGIVRKTGDLKPYVLSTTDDVYNHGVRKKGLINNVHHSGDSGSYSRYFDLDKWFDTTFPFLIVPKASSSEKNKGLDAFIEKSVDCLHGNKDGTFNKRTGGKPSTHKNIHPTVKPLKLMSWLVTLLTRPKDIVLDLFCGSGTTCLAAQMLKRNWIGIELNKEYIEIAEQRLKQEAGPLRDPPPSLS